jgi:CubicO group peptidase (beta-lactamase class C family)
MPESISHRVLENLLEPKMVRRTGFRSAPLEERMKVHRVPGVGVAVINNYEIAWAAGFGVREAGTSSPVTTDTLFQACSISKVATAAGALRLVQEGLLDLDEDVNRLRSWKVPPNGSWQPRITLRQLLSHSAGTTVHGFFGYRRSDQIPNRLQILEGQWPCSTWPVRVDILPGVRYRYSGGGITVVEQLMADVTQQPFPELMEELVFKPLGMAHSTFAQPLPERWWDMAASAHTPGGGVLEGRWNVYPETAAGGLWTTPSDLARLVVDLQRARAGRPSKLFTRETALEALKPNPGGCGLGFHLDGARFNHGGDNVGFKAVLVGYQDEGLGAVIMTNADEGWHLNNELIRAIAVEYQWPLDPVRDFPFYPTPESGAVPVPLALLASYAGEYETEEGYSFRVRTEGESLWIEAPGQPLLRLTALGESSFYSQELNLRLNITGEDSFALGLDGQPFNGKRR